MDAALRAVKQARQELAEAITRRTERDHITGKIIYMKFLARFGELEIKEHKLRYRDLYLTAKIRQMQAFVAQDLPIPLQKIREELEEDLGWYATYIEGMETLWKSSMRQYRMEETMTLQRETSRRLYRELVAAASPELYPTSDPRRVHLFRQGEQAYQKSDALRLQLIHALCVQQGPPDPPGSNEALHEERMRLQERTREMNAWTQLRTAGFPFEYEDLVEDETRIEARIQASQALIRAYEETIIAHQKTVAKLLRSHPTV